MPTLRTTRSAGSGWQEAAPTPAPYHRVFNPDSQAARFDADGRYRERWLGDEERPAPMVDHRSARLRALAAHASANG
jgi:deoxyribodipyrimidine photo-lyase